MPALMALPDAPLPYHLASNRNLTADTHPLGKE
jgi:hypothetical protein